jgi:23S rRNA (pseudouridine1915-N3)-methyltransferase
MHLTIIAVGRARDADEARIVARYLARMRSKPELIEIHNRKSRNAADEWQQMEARIPNGAARVFLDERGCDLPSPKFAARLGQWRDDGRDIACLIGGAYGFPDAARQSADLILAFGQATWPHMLVRAMLAEQLYRAQEILAGKPYHHG